MTNEKNGRAVRVKVNDRGPFVAGRIVDLSKAAAAEIGMVGDGVAPVTVAVVSVGSNERRPGGYPDETNATAGGPWAVQAGAFGNEENARKVLAKLRADYPGPFLEDFRGLKRVKFGPYRTRAEADAARDTLEVHALAGIVVPYR